MAADPHLIMADSNGNPLANLEWLVTDNPDPTQVSNAVLLNGVPVIPTTYGTVPGRDGIPTMAGYDPAITGTTDHSGASFNLVLAGGADGYTMARLTPPVRAGRCSHRPQQVARSPLPHSWPSTAAMASTPWGGGSFQVYYQPTGTMNLAIPMPSR